MQTMVDIKKCEVCGKVSEKRCGKCHGVYYCSKEHQVLGWKTHRKVCRPFKIRSNEELGRYIVATKPIQEGAMILQEPPLALCSKRSVLPVCMGCSTTLNITNIPRCSECGWPLCSEQCPDKANHEPECYFTKQTGKKISVAYEYIISLTIITLRCLYQKKFCPEAWEKLKEMESHCEKSKSDVQLESKKRQVVNNIYNVFRLRDEFTEDEIKRVCGIVAVNGFDISQDSPFEMGIYQIGSIFEHSCKANSYRVFSPKGKLTIVAGMDIKEGDHVSISYVSALWTTPKRQRYLQEGKFFTCRCERCADVTEFGTNCSALKCQNKNCEGILLPESFLIAGMSWTCNKCKFKMPADSAEEVLRSVEGKLDELKADNSHEYEYQYKTFLRNNEKLISQNHSCMIYAKLDLMNKLEVLDKVSGSQLTLINNLCHEVLDILQALGPAEKRLKVNVLMVLVEMHHKNLARPMPAKDSRGILMEQRMAFIEYIKFFQHVSPEGHLQAQRDLKMVESRLADLNV